MRRQLRPFYTPEQLREVYAQPYDHTRWADHRERIAYTAARLKAMKPVSVADLSCGDGAIVREAKLGPDVPTVLGDFVPGWEYPGPIEQTIMQIPHVDVFVLSETLEHVEDPEELLWTIRGKADRLLMSTPCGENDDGNPEHYWGWDTIGVEEMLDKAGWRTRQVELFTPTAVAYYTFQVWECS